MVADLVINVFEEDRYWLIARKLDEIGPGDLIRLADVLRDWGLGDVAEVATRARHRLRFLAAFEQLVVDPTTLELGGVHRVLEAHAWLLGDQYELWASNRTMRRIVQQYCDEVYSGSNGRKRPDLVLVGLQQRFLLVELKRPSHEIGRQDMAQAEEYRDGLQAHLRDAVFQILVVGGSIERNLPRDDRREVRVSTYDELLIEARNRLDWLLKNIDAAEDQAPAQPRMPF